MIILQISTIVAAIEHTCKIGLRAIQHHYEKGITTMA